MTRDEMLELAEKFLGAWNTQEVEKVVGVYTEDVAYCDPSTRGMINGRNDLRRYLTKLLAAWDMTWAMREGFLFEGGNGCAFLWRATLKKMGGDKMVEVNGMDLVIVENGLIKRNEVYFDRSALAALL